MANSARLTFSSREIEFFDRPPFRREANGTFGVRDDLAFRISRLPLLRFQTNILPCMPFSKPDLTQQPPRSPRVRLGGYVILPRMLDKGRAMLAKKPGDYHFGCPLDKRFLAFTGIQLPAIRKLLASGRGDGEILAWIQAHAKPRRTEVEIQQWSAWQESRVPTSVDSREFFNELHQKVAMKREDITSWFDLLDLDDYVSFGGKA